MEDDPFEITMPTGDGPRGESSGKETVPPTIAPKTRAPKSVAPVVGETPAAGTTDARQYKVGREIAKGGMGRILEAEDVGLRRTVAMKVMLGERASDGAQKRFTREAEVLARLEHPNIVPIHELGRDDQGQAFYTMKMVKGRTLQQIIDALKSGDQATSKDYDLDHLLTVFRKICDAMAFAHHHQIVHRDLKPDNVMVGEFGEVLVMDWGLAKILTEDEGEDRSDSESGEIDFSNAELNDAADLTLDGEYIGTPRYMPPEQAGGKADEVDSRSDVFALGGILYAILTLHPPIRGNTLQELLDNLKTGNIEAPTEFGSATGMGTRIDAPSGRAPTDISGLTLDHCPDGKVPPSLSAVAMRALAVEKKDRYQTVGELADDIDRFKGGFATSVESLGAFAQAMLFIRRHRAVSISVFASLILVAVLTAVFMNKLIASNKATQAKADEAAENALVALGNEKTARQNALLAEANAAEAKKNEAEAKENAMRAEQNAARAEAEATTAKAVSDFLVGMFEDADPIARHGRTMGARGKVGPELTAREILGYGIKSLDGSLTNSPIIRAGLLDKVGNVCLSLGLYDESAPLIAEALEIRRAEHGPEHLDVAASLRALGMVHFYQGEHTKAEQALGESLKMLEKLHGTNHPAVSDVALDLGVVSFVNHDEKVAKNLMERSLAIRERTYGKDSREVLAAMLFLVVLENTGGRSNASRVEDLAKLWGDSSDTPEFGEFINRFIEGNIAAFTDKQAAAKLFAESAEIGNRLLGEKHLIMSLFRSRHAMLLANLGQKETATKMLESAIENVRESQGENFILIGNLAQSLGGIESNRSKGGILENAEKAFRLSAAVYLEHLMINPSELYAKQYRQSMLRLSVVLIQQGKYRPAATVLGQLVNRYGKELEKYPEITQRYVYLCLHPDKPELLNSELSMRSLTRDPLTTYRGAIKYAKAYATTKERYKRPMVVKALRETCLNYLKRAISRGFKQRTKIEENSVFDPFRDSDEFQEIVGKIRNPR